jgi:hypothetical protein
MKDDFENYLKAIGMTNVLVAKVGKVYDFYQSVCPEEITHIFVNDFVTQDSARTYGSLWLFSLNYVMEAHNFTNQDWFDMAPLRKAVASWTVEKQDYDFVNTTAKSRLSIRVNLLGAQGVPSTFQASKDNCDYLRKILGECILPNFASMA